MSLKEKLKSILYKNNTSSDKEFHSSEIHRNNYIAKIDAHDPIISGVNALEKKLYKGKDSDSSIMYRNAYVETVNPYLIKKKGKETDQASGQYIQKLENAVKKRGYVTDYFGSNLSKLPANTLNYEKPLKIRFLYSHDEKSAMHSGNKTIEPDCYPTDILPGLKKELVEVKYDKEPEIEVFGERKTIYNYISGRVKYSDDWKTFWTGSVRRHQTTSKEVTPSDCDVIVLLDREKDTLKEAYNALYKKKMPVIFLDAITKSRKMRKTVYKQENLSDMVVDFFLDGD